MQKPNSHTIREATERAKQQLTIENLKAKTKYANITESEYDKLFKAAETISLLILEQFAKSESAKESL